MTTDDTKKVVREFQNDRRINYYYKSHGGVSSARKFGLNYAQSSLVTYVDSDDIIFPEYLDIFGYFRILFLASPVQ